MTGAAVYAAPASPGASTPTILHNGSVIPGPPAVEDAKPEMKSSGLTLTMPFERDKRLSWGDELRRFTKRLTIVRLRKASDLVDEDDINDVQRWHKGFSEQVENLEL